MTDISKEAVDALIDHLRGMGEHEAPPVLEALLAALDEAEAREAAMLAANEINRETLLRHNADCDRRIRKAEAERDVARVEWQRTLDRANENYARAVKAGAERDAANALLREIAKLTSQHGGAAQALKLIRAHLGAKP